VRSLSGRELAGQIRAATADLAARLTAAGSPPRLAIVAATADESSAWYVRSLTRAADKVGIACQVAELVEDISKTLSMLSADPLVHGIILATPLPDGARLAALAEAIDPAKDVDGASPASLGRLMTGERGFAPATAEAVVRLLDYHGVALGGTRVVVVGRSAIVGKPVTHLLLDRDATVTVCHSRTRDLASVTSSAEVLVVAAGRPGLIGVDHVAPGAIVVDVGTNVLESGELTGDVAPEVAAVAGALSPVPGGVGPVTTALLLQHVVEAAGPP
jgi:methylenetetrahydrofolate dehydrogenase (NADP+)/methenyltetrahydrofolate cyclohydrolase